MTIQELRIPDQVRLVNYANELIRAWIADQRMVCSLKSDAFENPAAWGVLLADLANRLAEEVSQVQGRDHDAVLKMIVDAFDGELTTPPGEHTGQVVSPEQLADSEKEVVAKASNYLRTSIGDSGRDILRKHSSIWLTVIAFGYGSIRAFAAEGTPSARLLSMSIPVFQGLGLEAKQSAQYSHWLSGHLEDPATAAMIAEGERATKQWQESGGEPTRLGELLTQMLQIVREQSNKEG